MRTLKAAEVKQLYKKRALILKRLESFVEFIEPLESINDLTEQKISELEINVQDIEDSRKEFNSVQESIELNCADDLIDDEFEKRKNFDDKYRRYMSIAKCISKKWYFSQESGDFSSTARVEQRETVQGACGLEGIRLPPIRLPSFNSDYLRWLEYKNTYEALIHNNKTLSDIQKYLKSSLTDEAISIIQDLDFSPQNYMYAWETLCNRYNNKRMLVDNHIKALFNIQNLAKESASGIRTLIDTVKKHLYALKSLELPTEHWDAIIIHIISLKLDKVTSREWELIKGDNNMPRLDELFEFLKKRADFLETLDLNQQVSQNKSDNRNKNLSRSLVVNNAGKSCNFCKQDHMIYNCEKFLKLSINDRWAQIKKLKLCSNCLCIGHFNSKCQRFGCKICKRKHSSLLHENKHEDSSSIENIDLQQKGVADGVSNVSSLFSNQLTDIESNLKQSSNEILALQNKREIESARSLVLLSTANIKVVDHLDEAVWETWREALSIATPEVWRNCIYKCEKLIEDWWIRENKINEISPIIITINGDDSDDDDSDGDDSVNNND
ncbi:uncharacterized protein LOC126880811 [Diabrotica virgifera virgifera]|uniref:Uncharacterized protein n=1 Tax=Diabrotica virgifera virgifera TaxID=50390 RepID=A0ABM5JSC3_DIAVI|nr:uncharacterized protein LOC126880811 [Diabrotica virgifera virgifera]